MLIFFRPWCLRWAPSSAGTWELLRLSLGASVAFALFFDSGRMARRPLEPFRNDAVFFFGIGAASILTGLASGAAQIALGSHADRRLRGDLSRSASPCSSPTETTSAGSSE